MKALFIDSKNSKVSVIDLDTSGEEGFKKISETIGCEFFTAITIGKHDDGVSETLYCNDCGAIDGTDYGILHETYGPIFGNAIVTGTDRSGESVDTRWNPEDLAKNKISHTFHTEAERGMYIQELEMPK